MVNTDKEVQHLLEIIPFGKKNAVHAIDIAKELGYECGGNQVETRQLIRYAIRKGHIILSTSKNGYWCSNSKQEIENCIKGLRNRAEDINKRSIELKENWNKNNPNNLIK